MNDLKTMKYFLGKIQINDETNDYQYKLKDFYIKTAHNCFCNGYLKNDHVDVCALKNCASYGVRALDIQVYSKNKKPIIGIINCPAHDERWVGAKNQSSTINQQTINTSSVTAIEDAYIFTSGLYFDEPHLRNAVDKIKNKVRYFRYGGDCYMYGMVASGLIDIVIEDTLKVHDYMALVNVIEGAGGVISDKFGNEITTDSHGSVVASANKELHSKLISLINE